MAKILSFFKVFFLLLFQYAVNYFNLTDHILNTILLGDPDETLSSRIARARQAGHKWAMVMCNVLTFLAKVVTFGQVTVNHCDYALDSKQLGSDKEIWSWSQGKILTTPVNEVEVVILNQGKDNA
jgi:hypothetical protein